MKLHFPTGKLQYCITFYVLETKLAEFANNVDLDGVAHNEPPHLDLHCLIMSHLIKIYIVCSLVVEFSI